MPEDREEKPKELTSQERSNQCRLEIQESLKKYRCSITAQPSYKMRDDGTWSLITGVEIVPQLDRFDG